MPDGKVAQLDLLEDPSIPHHLTKTGDDEVFVVLRVVGLKVQHLWERLVFVIRCLEVLEDTEETRSPEVGVFSRNVLVPVHTICPVAVNDERANLRLDPRLLVGPLCAPLDMRAIALCLVHCIEDDANVPEE